MKRCPTCQRTYSDQNLSYCIDDGTPLVPIAVDDETTAVSSRRSTTPDEDWNAVAYRPPGAYTPPETGKRKVWPWVLGIVSVVVLALVALGVAAAFLVPQLLRRANRNDTVVESSNRNKETVPTPMPRNSPSTNSNSQTPANTNAGANTNTDAPTDKELVLAQLTDLENEWTVANLNADKKKLQEILADDYVGPSSGGGVEGKRDYIANIQRDRSIQKWEFKGLKVTLRGDRATLSGQVHFTRNNETEVYDFTDKFVWRDGRWQATGSVVTRA
ncbi:MAG TPA: nuclear transport factor 2 family protein [Pyrinomonadaceae bacterium]|nr:nuclear transport factor 2 family protein [Pyrinomonadaceae bacterium]